MDLFDFSLKLPITDPTWIFLLVLLIILFAPILLNRLRIPHIIGMILAGLVIGEHGFNKHGIVVSSCLARWVYTISCFWLVWK